MNGEPDSDNNTKTVYQISLSSNTLGLISPYLFVEKLKEKILANLPDIKVSVVYHTKGQAPKQPLVQLKCFTSKSISDYQINNIKEIIGSIYFDLHHELSDRIEQNRDSVA